MKMSEGVEWAMHSCLNLAWAGEVRAVTAAKLAKYHELPAAYLNKQLQALTRAGILSSTSGPRGGFRLARSLSTVTLMDIVTAIEGPEDAFACTEIRQLGPGGGPPEAFPHDCAVKLAMARAELAWRKELAAQTLEDVLLAAERRTPGLAERIQRWFTDN